MAKTQKVISLLLAQLVVGYAEAHATRKARSTSETPCGVQMVEGPTEHEPYKTTVTRILFKSRDIAEQAMSIRTIMKMAYYQNFPIDLDGESFFSLTTVPGIETLDTFTHQPGAALLDTYMFVYKLRAHIDSVLYADTEFGQSIETTEVQLKEKLAELRRLLYGLMCDISIGLVSQNAANPDVPPRGTVLDHNFLAFGRQRSLTYEIHRIYMLMKDVVDATTRIIDINTAIKRSLT